MKKIICIDSNIFIWGVRGVATAGQEEFIKRAKNFLSWIDTKDFGILIPAPMLAEILSPVPLNEQPAILALLDKRFLIAPFDAPCIFKMC